MFTRTHRFGRYAYIEVLESYRDPGTGRSRHRCVTRWRAERSFAEELGHTRWRIECAAEQLAFWQGIIDRTARPRFQKQRQRAPDCLQYWRRELATATAHFAALTEARKGLPADEAVIDHAATAAAARWASLTTRTRAVLSPPSIDLSGLAERVRGLAALNDPDALRAEITAIATALDSAAVR